VEKPAIIEAAINGVTSKLQNPKVPRSPEEIADDAQRCLAAGAAIVHNHVDVVMVDGPTAAECYLDCWRTVWANVPGALLYPTVNAGPVQESFAHFPLLAAAGCRIGIVDAGTVNLGNFVYLNSRSDIDHQVQVCVENRLAPSMAIFEPGFLRLALQLWKGGRLPAGTMIKLYFGGEAGYLGGVFGLPPTKPAFEAYMSMLDGCPLPWSVAVIGDDPAKIHRNPRPKTQTVPQAVTKRTCTPANLWCQPAKKTTSCQRARTGPSGSCSTADSVSRFITLLRPVS
jgi:uncharacterized protein (DUF849 family)